MIGSLFEVLYKIALARTKVPYLRGQIELSDWFALWQNSLICGTGAKRISIFFFSHHRGCTDLREGRVAGTISRTS